MDINADLSHEWLTNAGATHHVTNDASNLHNHSDHGGKDRYMVGDGSVLHISSIGSTFIDGLS